MWKAELLVHGVVVSAEETTLNDEHGRGGGMRLQPALSAALKRALRRGQVKTGKGKILVSLRYGSGDTRLAKLADVDVTADGADVESAVASAVIDIGSCFRHRTKGVSEWLPKTSGGLLVW